MDHDSPEDTPQTVATIVTIVSTKLLDPDYFPDLYETVAKSMLHRSCGVDRPNAACMDGPRRYTKGYP